MEGQSEPKKPSSSLKKVGSFKTQSETQTAVAVRVPSLSQNEAKEAAERLVTDEQAHSASMARKRRLMTKNRAQGVRTREKTPEPSKSSIAHEDTTTTDEEDSRSPKSPSEREADDIYAEMRRKLKEKNYDRDDDDIDIDAIREQRGEEAKERRRRSISPFALPSKEDIAKLQRKGSFIDPGNKLLSTVPTYAITPKDEMDSNSRKSSLVREEGLVRKDSLIVPPSPTTPGRQSSPFQLSTPPSPRKTEHSVSAEKNIKQDTNPPKSPSIKQNPVTVKPKQSSLKVSTNINTSIVNRPQDPTQKITSVSPNAGNMSTNTAQIQKSEPSNAPPIKPKRSKSGTRSQGRTSESEMSDDQNRRKIEQQPVKPPKPKERRRTIAAIKRSVRERSPTAKRSQSATRADQPLDVTGIELSQASSEIIDLLQKARRRSISIPDEDLKLSSADYANVDKSRQLMTPNKTPSTPKKGLKITSTKKIEILSQEEMMESFQKAQRKSMEIERSRRSSGYIDASQSEITSSCYSSSYSEDESDFDITKRSAELARKLNLLQHENETAKIKENKTEVLPPITPEDAMAIAEAEAKMSSMRVMFRNARRVWKVFKVEQKLDYDKIKALRNRCFNDLIIMLIFCGVGGFVFRYTEGAFENFYKCGVRRVKRDFIDSLWQGSHNMREDDWKSMARKKLWEFESQLHTAHEAGVHSYSGQKSWSFMNSVVYCLTVVTTIGYGHIAPSTTTGRAITIVYAIFGIPLFLILLADFGKLFTRCIKFLWAFVRRLYYTGSCRKVRKTVQVQEVMKGLNMVYEAASTFRRPSQYSLDNPEGLDEPPPQLPPKPNSPKPQTPSSGLLNVAPSFKREATEDGVIDMGSNTPAPSVFAIDDEFNLPISVAITCLIIYIFFGASIYVVWEDWGFFESFYFVFISMSTIGFGDFVPNHPMYMMGSIIYLVFGMALTSMCINVVQVKLSDSFRQASAKIGATIGLRVSEEDGSLAPVTPVAVEVPAIHGGAKTQENNAPVPV